MAQENKKGYVEESIDRDAQIHFENHCSTGSLVITDILNKELGDHPLKDYILSNISISTASAFCQGALYGWSHPQKVDVENLPQEIKDLNYLFAFNFYDNDFGCEFEEGAENFCYDHKPTKLTEAFVSGGCGMSIKIDSKLFSEVTFENSPKRVELKLI